MPVVHLEGRRIRHFEQQNARGQVAPGHAVHAEQVQLVRRRAAAAAVVGGGIVVVGRLGRRRRRGRLRRGRPRTVVLVLNVAPVVPLDDDDQVLGRIERQVEVRADVEMERLAADVDLAVLGSPLVVDAVVAQGVVDRGQRVDLERGRPVRRAPRRRDVVGPADIHARLELVDRRGPSDEKVGRRRLELVPVPLALEQPVELLGRRPRPAAVAGRRDVARRVRVDDAVPVALDRVAQVDVLPDEAV